MRLWGTLMCIFYVLEFTVIHTLDKPGPELPTPENKGELNISKRIFGGRYSSVGEFPYQVLIYYWKDSLEYMCGGAIISEQHILTAAHCVSNVSKIQVLAGNIDRNTRENWIYASVFEIYVHEDFLPEEQESPEGPYNDVAVIKLQERFSLDGKVTASVKLRDKEVSSGELCIVTGWGKTEDESYSTILRYADLSIVDRKTCSVQLERKLQPGEICAGQSSGGKDSCEGDSGGPLVCDGYLTGVVSWGIECAFPNTPGVYTNVVWYKEWIENRTATVPQENSNLYELNTKNIETGFTSVIYVLSFITLLRYLIQ